MFWKFWKNATITNWKDTTNFKRATKHIFSSDAFKKWREKWMEIGLDEGIIHMHVSKFIQKSNL